MKKREMKKPYSDMVIPDCTRGKFDITLVIVVYKQARDKLRAGNSRMQISIVHCGRRRPGRVARGYLH